MQSSREYKPQIAVPSHTESRPAPNFMLIGGQKCGTSWLAKMLGQHPQIFVPKEKEVHFFNKKENFDKGLEWYLRFFAGASRAKAIGDCTPNYLWAALTEEEQKAEGLPGNIPALVHEAYPDARLIAILRNPVDRAVSAYFHHIGARRLSPRTKFSRTWGQYGIKSMGLYHANLQQWLRYFDREQILILIYEEDVSRGKEKTLERVFSFLGVDTDFRPQALEQRFNKRSGSGYLHMYYYAPQLTERLSRMLPALKKLAYPRLEVSREERRRLWREYEDDVRQLEDLLDRKLDVWREMYRD